MRLAVLSSPVPHGVTAHASLSTTADNGIMQLSETDKPITVGVVDNDTLTLGALRAFLTRLRDIDVAWTSGDGSHAIDLCRNPRNRPDVLLIDMSMEPLPGTEVCRRIHALGLTTGLVCITSFTLRTYAARAAEAGAQAIVSKTDLAGMRDAIRLAAQGKASPSPIPGLVFPNCRQISENTEGTGQSGNTVEVMRNADAADLSPGFTAGDGAGTIGIPSARELQIIRMVADGMETEEISRALALSRYTIATYLKRACDKLGARNRINLIAICERRGLL